ncbi:hypothetical protein N798_12290 [Knoellia flava TL1]|uniref:Protein-glutamine gamma-glutamyltransferase-like C-terminal domain-containing protein n=2 Tax=Knoellia flava TaxID=913969 RepID=A0A8H9FQ80_9MICO|nr:DUF4129 domain-containing protein [Knoellia flava]KGN29901.1 hypothetical protein N798_12290 [Knoellia flava TL1]GGB70518.1 hypothetical protein GCM10011314_07290 [Knoellia flava]
MGRRDWAWAAGTAGALLLAAWVSGAGPIAAFTTPGLSPPTDDEFGELVQPDTGDARQPEGERTRPLEDNELVANVVAWTLRVVLVLIVAVVVLLVVRALLRRLRRDPVTPKDEVEAPVLPDVLVAGVRASEAQLEHGTSTEAVINAWLTLERTAAEVGLEDDVARTPAELVGAVLGDFDVDRVAIERLADLYREARFSVHPIGETQRAEAREALRSVREDLTRPLRALGGSVAR